MENRFNKRMDRSPRDQQNVISFQPRISGQYQYKSSREPEIIYLRPRRKTKVVIQSKCEISR
jgi:hypothetical protein